jgi:hypothetical protein
MLPERTVKDKSFVSPTRRPARSSRLDQKRNRWPSEK